ncbi:MAG: hypothetical protein ACOYNX_10985 [Geothrix sp.]
MIRSRLVSLGLGVGALLGGLACTAVQTTTGGGLTSVIAQNVVRIACVTALRPMDPSAFAGKKVELKLTGFNDDKNRGILELMIKSKIEQNKGIIATAEAAEIQAEVAILSAGNDAGASRMIVVNSDRTLGSVDLVLTLRNAKSGAYISSKSLRGEAKYEQTAILGFQKDGKYYVKNAKGDYEIIQDPKSYN